MPNVSAPALAREAGAILQADLTTCGAVTLEGLREATVAALAAVYPKPQAVSVRRDDPASDGVTITIKGPHFVGRIEMQAPDCT